MYSVGKILAELSQFNQTEETLHMCSYKKVIRKYTANLQENTHAEVRFRFIEITL